MNKVIRYSTLDDVESIDKLLRESFGDRYKYNVFDNIDNRYLVCEIDGAVVAMTGLSKDTEFKDGVEIDWTCTDRDYRQLGIMQELFTKLLTNVKSKVYCSCWRIGDNEYPNIKTLMDMFGFKCIIKSIRKSEFMYNCPVEYCVYQSSNCYCAEDLYLREIKEI